MTHREQKDREQKGLQMPKNPPKMPKCKPKALDKQEGGRHYDLPIQPLEYIHANRLGYIEGNIIKYATRHRNKNGAEDIKKIIHYCELLLELEYAKDSEEEELRGHNPSEHREGQGVTKPAYFGPTFGHYSKTDN